MERVAFAMKLLPGAEAEYRRRHAAVWPEMLDALRAGGARNYSIYLHGNDLFGVLEVDDFARFRSMMDGAPVNARWQADMAFLIDPCIDPATGFHKRLDEVFHLDWTTPGCREYMDLVIVRRAEGVSLDELRAVVAAFGVKTTLV